MEAAIQSAHVARCLTGVDNWPAVVALYDHLLALTGSPVVALNRAAALSEVEGPLVALAALDAVADDRRLADYQPIGRRAATCSPSPGASRRRARR